METYEITDVRIDLRYGQIAGKWWGSRNMRPILLVHGYSDNAGTFDTLIPLLPKEFSYLAIDFPGHGMSSHLPKGCYYHSIDLVGIIEEIRTYFKWQRISIIGHSMGSFVSFFYATLYSEFVDLVVALDTLKMQSFRPKTVERIFYFQTKRSIEADKHITDKPPDYTYDEMERRVHEGTQRSVDCDKAKYLVDRGSKPSTTDPEKFNFTRDIRVKYMHPFYMDHKIGLEYLKNIRAPYLFIRSDDQIFHDSERNTREGVELFKKCNKHFEFLKVKGTHHVHLNQPELMADTICKFLKKYHVQEEQITDTAKLKSKL